MKRSKNWYTYYKGYSIYQIRGEYRAEAYANENFYNTNLSKLKKDINKYLSFK